MHGLPVDPRAITESCSARCAQPDPARRSPTTPEGVGQSRRARRGPPRRAGHASRTRSTSSYPSADASESSAARTRTPGSRASTRPTRERLARCRRCPHAPRRPGATLLDRAARAPRRRPRRHPHARRRRAPRRPAGRGGRRRDRGSRRGGMPAASDVEYELLPAVFDPEQARSAGRAAPAPGRTDPSDRVGGCRAQRRRSRSTTGYGDVDAALAASDGHRQRHVAHAAREHAQLETHGSIGWLDDDGRLVIRTSTQVPFLVRDELCAVLLDLPPGPGARLRRHASAAASAASRRCSPKTSSRSRSCAPADRCATSSRRTDEFTARAVPASDAGHGHAGRERATAPSPRMKVDVLSDTGAYGNHAPRRDVPRLRASRSAVYTLPDQARRRRGGVHEQHAVGCVPRLRARAGDPRRRIGDGRARRASRASTRSSCAAATSVREGDPLRDRTTRRRRTSSGARTGSTSASTWPRPR